MVLFTAIVVLCFSRVGRLVQGSRLESKRSRLFLWAIGATLFSHVMSFMSVSYFDQNVVNWFLTLAAVAAANASRRHQKQPAIKTSESEAPASVSNLEEQTLVRFA